jgi:hypothetical protein
MRDRPEEDNPIIHFFDPLFHKFYGQYSITHDLHTDDKKRSVYIFQTFGFQENNILHNSQNSLYNQIDHPGVLGKKDPENLRNYYENICQKKKTLTTNTLKRIIFLFLKNL